MAADDNGSSGSSTRMESTHLLSRRNHQRNSPDEGSVPSSQPPRQIMIAPSSPIHGGRNYSLRSTPERERRVLNNQHGHPSMVLTQLATVSSERSSAIRQQQHQQQQQQQMPAPHLRQQVLPPPAVGCLGIYEVKI
jgi:hypothetical protein